MAAFIVAVMGGAFLLSVKSGWVNYLWDRYAYGGVAQVAGQCYELPPRWTILPNGDMEGVVDVQRHFAGGRTEVFVSILPAHMVDGVQHRGKVESAPRNGGFTIYDLSASALVRYIAINEAKATALMGGRKDLIDELASDLSTCQ